MCDVDGRHWLSNAFIRSTNTSYWCICILVFADMEKRYVSRSERILQNAKNVLWKRAALKAVQSRLNVETVWQETIEPRVSLFISHFISCNVR
jgi:hypothetical protein